MKFTGTYVSTIGDSDQYDIESCSFFHVDVFATNYNDAVFKFKHVGLHKLCGLDKDKNWKIWDITEIEE